MGQSKEILLTKERCSYHIDLWQYSNTVSTDENLKQQMKAHVNQIHKGQQCQSPHEIREYSGKTSSAKVFSILHHRITQWLWLGGISEELLVPPLCQCRFTQSRLHRITCIWTLNMSRGYICQHCSALIMPSCC